MFLDEIGGMGTRFGVQHIGDVTLLPKLDGFRFVRRSVRIPHLREKAAQGVRVGMGELDKLEPVGAGGVFGSDFGFRCVVGEGTHGILLLQVATIVERNRHSFCAILPSDSQISHDICDNGAIDAHYSHE